MTTDTTVNVALQDRSYPIHIGSDLLKQAGPLLAPIIQKPRVFIITDENVAPHYLGTVQASFENIDIRSDALVLPAGEATKSFANLQIVVEAMLEAKVERSTTVIALGGGVIGDLTGFAASITLRGLDFAQIPTSLLAQVDSSVGGKTGINTDHGKNLAGSFHQPKAVLVDIDTLKTLPDRERLAGYAEVCKYGLLGDAEFWSWLEEHGKRVVQGEEAAVTKAIHTSCTAKARVVADDEHEHGVRALLNLGHTFGHAFEAELGYSGALLHGEGVSIGMALAFDLSVRLGHCQADDGLRVRKHLEGVGLPTTLPGQSKHIEPCVFLDHMKQDKKVSDGSMTFVLARKIGDTFLTQDVPEDDVLAVLEAAQTS